MSRDLQRDEGYLFWLAWVSHNSNSLFQTGDAQGPFRRFIALATCSTYKQIAARSRRRRTRSWRTCWE